MHNPITVIPMINGPMTGLTQSDKIVTLSVGS
jgi:hypothetical protein